MTAIDTVSVAGAAREMPPEVKELPVDVAGERNPAYWGLWLMICTEATLFACLLFSYYYVRADQPVWPPGGIKKEDLTLPLLSTAILLTSSIPIWWGEEGIKKGNQRQLLAGLGLGFLEGLTFILLEIFEWLNKDFNMSTNVYGSLFFTITGLHGIHLLIALYMNLVVQARTWLGHFNEERHLGVQLFSLYWHFVDVVWVFVFFTVYLSPYLY